MSTEGRIQVGIRDAEQFWQLVQDTGYLIEGENKAFELEYMAALKASLDKWFADHPEIAASALDHFAMRAVHRLVGAFGFNDKIGADEPDFRERMFDRVVRPLVDRNNSPLGWMSYKQAIMNCQCDTAAGPRAGGKAKAEAAGASARAAPAGCRQSKFQDSWR